MARNGSGTFSLPQAPFVTNTTISSTATNSNNSDIAAALTQSISKDGQTTYTGNQPMGGNKLTGLGVGTAVADSAAMSQLYGVPTYGGVGGGTADAITITPSPGVTAYAIGQKFSFKASGANTGAVTLNVNTVGVGAVTWPDGTALVAGDIPSGGMIEVEVQATTPVFHLQTPKAPTTINQSTTGPTVQNLTSGTAATYTTPAGVKWIKVLVSGAGGGGGAVGASTAPNGATGGTTTFNSITAIGGTGGGGGSTSTNTRGGTGGAGGTGAATRRVAGNQGSIGLNYIGAQNFQGGAGAGSPWFGGAVSVTPSASAGAAGTSAAANTGAGGTGAGGQSGNASNWAAGGGGSGECFELIIINPSATYTYTIGAGGAGGIGTGTGAATGGAGGSGFITVEEHYTY